MKKFPGEVLRYGGSNGTKIHLTDEQREWLIRWYPVTENSRLAKAMKIYVDRVRDFARELGLQKSEEGMKAINLRRVKRATKTNYKNGCYDRKRGKPVSDATIAGLRKRWQRIHNGELEEPITHIRNTDPQRYATLMKKMGEKRRELIRKEQLRVVYGLERKTKLKIVVLKAYTQSQTHHRCSALKRGYLLDADCSEGSPGRYTIYYDDQTERSKRFEENCRRDGFRIMPDT